MPLAIAVNYKNKEFCKLLVECGAAVANCHCIIQRKGQWQYVELWNLLAWNGLPFLLSSHVICDKQLLESTDEAI